MTPIRQAQVLALLIVLSACMTRNARPPGREVVTTVSIPANPDRIVRAFLDADDMRSWWKVSRSLVIQQPGGTWAVSWDDYGQEKTTHVWAGKIVEIEPHRLLIDDLIHVEPNQPFYAPLQLEIIAEPTEAGCDLTVVHRGYRYGADWDQLHDRVVAGWRHVLADLKSWFVTQA